MKSESISTRRSRRRKLRRDRQQHRGRSNPIHRFSELVFLLVNIVLAMAMVSTVDGFQFRSIPRRRNSDNHHPPTKSRQALDAKQLNSSVFYSANEDKTETTNIGSFDDAIRNRYACTRYSRYDGDYSPADKPQKKASSADPQVLQLAREALELSIRAPTGFNAQPYKLVLVESVAAKEALSKYCIGRNRDRVLDSDCTVLFLADRQAMSSWSGYKELLMESSERNRQKSKLAWLKLRALVALFSNGIPLPKLVAGPISFGIRLAMRIVSWFTRSWLVVPTLSSPECWSQKNTMLVAMAYMLGCSSRGLDTTPMEGYLSWGVRQSLGIPRRYTIPLMVSTGRSYKSSSATVKDGEDDAGMSHGKSPDKASPRFSIEWVVYENEFPK